MNRESWRQWRGRLVLSLGFLAMAAAVVAEAAALFLMGLLLIACGVLEMLETFQAPDEPGRRTAYLGGVLSILGGLLLLAQPDLLLGGLASLLALSFVIDGLARTVSALGTRGSGAPWRGRLVRGLAYVFLGLVLMGRGSVFGPKLIAVLVGLRILAVGWSILGARGRAAPAEEADPEVAGHPDHRLGLRPHREFAAWRATLDAEETARRPFDAYWFGAFVLTFFAIHVGRMRAAWDLVGLCSPLVATFGDVAAALLVAFLVLLPARLAWRRLTRPVERRVWERVLARLDRGEGPGPMARVYRAWLVPRMRFSLRMVRARTSPGAAVRWALHAGLPTITLFIALNPVWGFTWYFNSENWVSEVWDRWAEARTDVWREHMARAVRDRYRGGDVPEEDLFRVAPEGAAGADFSFLVLGDTGEGDASQYCLKDAFLSLGRRPDVKFLVVSSDVIYPNGAMSDYESKFYLPFKGFTKPIYAIPGNHDWYDALEGFAANFLEAEAARTCMRARVAADGRLTTTGEARIEGYIAEAARLRREFGVSTGWQRGPFFEVQAERFALLAVDTGVVRRVDREEWDWLNAALERAKGKFVLAVLGHPLYAGGRYRGHLDESFAAVHRLLRAHRVEVVMAGDTHYFEHYRETYPVEGGTRTLHHFVNGGGGAYLSIGTPLDWPERPAVPDCCYYPRRDAVLAKLDSQTPGWKWPLWLWVKHLRAWPSTAEAMAGAFDNNAAPYYQSFVEVRVEGSANRVRFLPHGANGPLRWRDLQTFGAVPPPGKAGDDTVEFDVPMPAGRS